MLALVLGGAFLTYVYRDYSPIHLRIAFGIPTGFTVFGLMAFLIALVAGPGRICLIATAALALLSSVVILLSYSSVISAELSESMTWARRKPSPWTLAGAVILVLVLVVLLIALDRAMFYRDGSLFTGIQNNYGDLMFHLTAIMRFAVGGNYPPIDPTYAGARFAYPFLSDFFASLLVNAGASPRAAMMMEGTALALAMIALLYRLALLLTGSRIAGVLTPLLVIFNGGFGFVSIFGEAGKAGGVGALLMNLRHDYTIGPDGYRWADSVTSLLIPERSILLGIPLVLVILIVWWESWSQGLSRVAGQEASKQASAPPSGHFRQLVAAGVFAGCLPLAHGHSFLVVMGAAVLLALLMKLRGGWISFFVASIAIAAPQLYWFSQGSDIHFVKFFQFHLGWENENQNIVLFWLKNTGAFIPLLVAAVVLIYRKETPSRRRKLFLFYLPFVLCFTVANLFKLAPWGWDNIKVLIYWYIVSAPIVAWILAALWRGSVTLRICSVLLVVILTLSGGLDCWRVVTGASDLLEFTNDDLSFSRKILEATPPNAVILHASVHNDPVMLTGRQSFLGYPGHIWTHGIDPDQREQVIAEIYAGTPEAVALISRYKIGYAVVSPAEELTMTVNQDFFSRFKLLVNDDSYRLYKLGPE